MTRRYLFSVIALMGCLSAILFQRVASPPQEQDEKEKAIIDWAGQAVPNKEADMQRDINNVYKAKLMRRIQLVNHVELRDVNVPQVMMSHHRLSFHLVARRGNVPFAGIIGLRESQTKALLGNQVDKSLDNELRF